MSTPEYRAKMAAYQREYRKRPGKSALKNAAERRWRQTKAGKKFRVFSELRRRAVKAGIPFSITNRDIEIPDCCPVLGIPLQHGVGRMSENSPSIDRLRPVLGYIHGNVRVISQLANRLKSNCTDPRAFAAVSEYVADMYSLRELCAMAQEQVGG